MKKIGSRIYVLASDSEEYHLHWFEVDSSADGGKLNISQGCILLGQRIILAVDPSMGIAGNHSTVAILGWVSARYCMVEVLFDVASGRLRWIHHMFSRPGSRLGCYLWDDFFCVCHYMTFPVIDFLRSSSGALETLFSVELLNTPCGFASLSRRCLLATSYV